MRRRKLCFLMAVFLLLNVLLYLLCIIFFPAFAIWVWSVLFVCECLAIAGVLVINHWIRTSGWFQSIHADYDHERYPDNIWYRKHDERNYELVSLGSYAAKFAFDYSKVLVKAMNWSSGVQTLLDDYRLVRNFHSILKKNGTVIITIMPFTSVNKKTGLMDSFKFYGTLDYELIVPEYRKKCRICERFPILFGRPALKAGLKKLLGKDLTPQDEHMVSCNPLSDEQLKKDAADRVRAWMNEFSMKSLEDDLTSENQAGREIRIQVMRELVDFIRERGYQAVWVIPPVSEYLAVYFTERFKNVYIYSYLKQVDRDVPLFDYLERDEFRNKDLYFNSYFLNRRGSEMFTGRVIDDLKKSGKL